MMSVVSLFSIASQQSQLQRVREYYSSTSNGRLVDSPDYDVAQGRAVRSANDKIQPWQTQPNDRTQHLKIVALNSYTSLQALICSFRHSPPRVSPRYLCKSRGKYALFLR